MCILNLRLAFSCYQSAWGRSQKVSRERAFAFGGVVGRPRGEGKFIHPLCCQHWLWEGWWSGTITKMVKGIASWEFPKEQSLVEDKPESGTQKYSKCQTPPIWKKQVAFKWIFRWFYAFWDPIFFFFLVWKWVWPPPPKGGKIPHFFFFFETLPKGNYY